MKSPKKDIEKLERKVRRQNRVLIVIGILVVFFAIVVIWYLFPNLRVPL